MLYSTAMGNATLTDLERYVRTKVELVLPLHDFKIQTGKIWAS